MEYVTSVCAMGIVVVSNGEVKEKGLLEAYEQRKVATEELQREVDLTIGEYRLKGWDLESREESMYDRIWLEEVKLTFVRNDYSVPMTERITVSLWLEDISVMK